MKPLLTIGSVCLLQVLTLSPLALDYHPVDISGQANSTFNNGATLNGHTYPTGSQNYGGVPFEIPAVGNNVWYSADGFHGGLNPHAIDVPVGLLGVTDVWSLINSYWGEQVGGTFASVEFFGSDTGYAKFDLDGDTDIRDYNDNPAYAGTINGTSSVEVFNNGAGQRLDRQHYALPADFADETLATIRFTDNGSDGFQRIFLGGVTVATPSTTVPDAGGSLVLLSLAGATLLLQRRRQSVR